MAKSTAYGIVLTDEGAKRLAVTASLRSGSGFFTADCNVTQSIRVVLYAVMEAVAKLESYIEGLDSDDFSIYDLSITMSGTSEPVDGESYGLPMAMAIVAAMLRKDFSNKVCFTGVIEPGGMILPVQDIDRKRSAAAALGFQKIVLPGRQIDLFSSIINQCPVDSIYGAVAGYFWE